MSARTFPERDTPWGPIAVADAHLHFFSDRFFDALIAQEQGLTRDQAGQVLGWRMPPHEPEKLAAEWIEELDQHQIALAALIGSVPGDEASVVAAARAYPERLFAHVMVDPKMVDARSWPPPEFAEIRTVCLYPAMHRFHMTEDCVKPVLDWARDNGRVIFVHCGVLSVGVRGKLGLASPFDMGYSNPIQLHAVATEYSEVPFIVPHFGAGYLREALMLADLCPNIYLDTSSSNGWMKYEGLELETVFRRALKVTGAERLLFGTDSSFFPRGWQASIFNEQVAVLKNIGISEADARGIFGKNLLRVLSR